MSSSSADGSGFDSGCQRGAASGGGITGVGRTGRRPGVDGTEGISTAGARSPSSAAAAGLGTAPKTMVEFGLGLAAGAGAGTWAAGGAAPNIIVEFGLPAAGAGLAAWGAVPNIMVLVAD